jgi:hypothetical protein
MKTLKLLMIILLTANYASAQTESKVWKQLKIDSVSFADKYGTPCEYAFQKDILNKSRHQFAAVFIGGKVNYLNRLASYLGNIYNYEGEVDAGTVFTPKIFTKAAPKIILNHGEDKNDRVTWVTITGPADDIINIFVDYWENTHISLNDLKSKKTIYQDFGSDRISFTWKGVNPVIIIKNVPGRSYIPKGCVL